jgi:hypothetical protein
MRKLLLAVVCLASASILVAPAFGGPSRTTRVVRPTGVDAGSCTAAAPCQTIGFAVDQASAGDTIAVGEGTYAESVTITKQLLLNGVGGAILDADGFDNGIVVSGAAASGTGIHGFTVENAGLEGIFAVQTSNLSITGNTLMNNDAYGPFAPQCINEPDDCGEALHLQSVTNSLVSHNSVHDNVGGILLTDENGPTSGNLIVANQVFDNEEDCGITLASHWFVPPPGPPAAAGVGGVYLNQVVGNTSNGNGAAGIGVFAGPPGAAAWGNLVLGNTAMNNGLPGIAIHSHTPFQFAGDNRIIQNTVADNGPDDDANSPPAGIVVFSDRSAGAAAIPRTTITANRIADEDVGIFTLNATTLIGLHTNLFVNVAVPISIH